jgi:hypothetical protein
MNFFLRGQRQIADLATGSRFLDQLHDAWAFRVVNGGHEKANPGRMWLTVRVVTGEDDIFVSEASGKGVYGAIDWRPLPYHHTALVKPTAENDDRYLSAKSFLQICRATNHKVYNRLWQVSNDIWHLRTTRIMEDFKYKVYLNLKSESKFPEFCIVNAECSYDVVLDSTKIDFGVLLRGNSHDEIWARSPQPIYVHQVTLKNLAASEREKVHSRISEILENDHETIWSSVFLSLSLRLNDDVQLVPGRFTPQSQHHPNWLLREYIVPDSARFIGRKVNLNIRYEAIVPKEIRDFSFFTPWVLDGCYIRFVLLGRFDSFRANQHIWPRVQEHLNEDSEIEGQREVTYSRDGLMLPGSSVDVRWQARKW